MYITRFAPSPTGHLHLGHLASAMAVWKIAHEWNAKIILRIEDHDRQRCKPEYEASILEDLEWLGFSANGITRQSEREGLYTANFERLRGQNDLYACSCTRGDLLARLGTEVVSCDEVTYDGFCRDRKLPLDGANTVRLKTDHGDFVIRDRLGNWSYQFACVSDDMDQNVNLIIRGEDILPSTPRQNYLRQRLGSQDIPLYFHHPLIYEEGSKEKLSKRHRSLTLKELRKQGFSPEDLKARLDGFGAQVAAIKPLTLGIEVSHL